MPLAAYTGNYTKIQKPAAGARLSLTRKPNVLSTDIVLNRLPDIFLWLPIGGDNSTFQVSISLESHPTGSFSFVTKAENRLYLETALPNGAEFEAFGIGWAVKSITIAEIPASDQPIRPILVSVSLGGKYENYVSIPIAYVKSAPKTEQSVDEDCQGKKNSDKTPKPKKTSVIAIARQAGVNFSAPGDWTFEIPSDASRSSSTTIANKLGELQFSNGCFIDYSNPEKITAIQPESVNQWEIGENLIIGGVSTNYQSKSPVFNQKLSKPKALSFNIKSGQVPGTKLSQTPLLLQQEPPPILSDYFWPRFKLDGIEKQKAKIEEEIIQGQGNKPRFRREPPTEYTLVSGDIDPNFPPGSGSPSDISQNFDQSGPKKTRKTTDYVNGQEVRSVIEIFGYVIYGEFSCFWDGEKWKKLFPGGAWKLVSRIETKQNFETKYGFNVGHTSKGWELVRFRQESADVPETAIAASLSSRDLTSDNISPLLSKAKSEEVLQLDSNLVKGFLGQISDLYRFVQNATIEEQVKTLVPESSLFITTDVVTELEGTDKMCLPNGKSALSDEPDPNYVPPYVLVELNTFKSNYLRNLNPEYQLQYHVNTQLELSEEDKQSRTIDPWVFTGSASLEQFKLDISNDVEGQESYTTYQSSYASSGPSFNLKLQQATYEQKLGRPSVESAPMAEVFSRIEEEDKDIGKKEKEAKEPHEHYIESVLENAPTGSKNLSGGSLTHANCDTSSKAQAAAKFDLWLRNIKGIGTKTLTIVYNEETSEIKVGDIVNLVVNNIKGKYRVTALSYTLKVHGVCQNKNLVTSEGINLTLVPEPVIELSYTKERPKKGKYSGKGTGAAIPGALSSISKLSKINGRF